VTTAPAPREGAVTSSPPKKPPTSAERSTLAVCVDVLGRVGANFVDGVAGVALASARTRIGDAPGAEEGFAYLID
jgi:hypothetical protein